MTMAGSLFVMTVGAILLKSVVGSIDPSKADVLLPAAGFLAAADLLGYAFLRMRLKGLWLEELAETPYRSGGDLPKNFSQAVLIGAALADGVGVFAAVIHLLSGSPLALGLAGLAFFSILALLPREESLLHPTRKP
jgi:hypothetical protein